eukprot:7870719-Pyramimonas_sp.AAC.1
MRLCLKSGQEGLLRGPGGGPEGIRRGSGGGPDGCEGGQGVRTTDYGEGPGVDAWRSQGGRLARQVATRQVATTRRATW